MGAFGREASILINQNSYRVLVRRGRTGREKHGLHNILSIDLEFINLALSCWQQSCFSDRPILFEDSEAPRCVRGYVSKRCSHVCHASVLKSHEMMKRLRSAPPRPSRGLRLHATTIYIYLPHQTSIASLLKIILLYFKQSLLILSSDWHQLSWISHSYLSTYVLHRTYAQSMEIGLLLLEWVPAK